MICNISMLSFLSFSEEDLFSFETTTGGQQTAPVIDLTENQPELLDSAQPPATVASISSSVVHPAVNPECSTTRELFPVRNE